MANYRPDQYAKKLTNNLNKLINSSAGFQEVAFRLVSITEKRIFDKGKDGNGGDIGTYSTKPLYVNPNLPTNRKKFPVKGKYNSSTKFKNGRTRKTSYFSGYTAYKQSQGMATLGSKVNLQVTKHFRRAFLSRSFPVSHQGSNIIMKLGVSPSPANPIGKLHGLMVKRYPNAFRFTKEERAFFNEEIRDLFINSLRA